MSLNEIVKVVRSVPLAETVIRPPLFYAACRRRLAEFDAMGEDQRRTVQLSKLRHVIAAAATAPFYKGSPKTEVQDFQPLTKQALREAGDGLLRRGARWGVFAAHTGGTTGVPLRVYRSYSSIVMEQATIDHAVASTGMELGGARIAVLRGDSIKPPSDLSPPFWTFKSGKKMVMSAHHLSPKTVQHYIGMLRSFRPDVIMAYPSSLSHLVELLAGAEERLSLPLAVTSSERLPVGLRARVREVTGAALLDYYGQAERVSFAWSVDDGVYWVRGDYGLMEFNRLGDGGCSALATGFHNTSFPLLRYETGDVFEVDKAAGGPRLGRIALGLEPFSGIGGRSAEFITTPDGRRVIGLNHIPRGVTGAISVQLIQDAPDHISVVVVPGPDYGDASRVMLEANLRAKIPENMIVSVELREAPARLKSGKAPLFINAVSSVAGM